MTFLEELRKLLHDATKTPWVLRNNGSLLLNEDGALVIAGHPGRNGPLMVLLANRSEALADLVGAAQHVVGKVEKPLPLNEALVLLNDCVNALEQENK